MQTEDQLFCAQKKMCENIHNKIIKQQNMEEKETPKDR